LYIVFKKKKKRNKIILVRPLTQYVLLLLPGWDGGSEAAPCSAGGTRATAIVYSCVGTTAGRGLERETGISVTGVRSNRGNTSIRKNKASEAV